MNSKYDQILQHLDELKAQIAERVTAVHELRKNQSNFKSAVVTELTAKAKSPLNHPSPCSDCDAFS